MLRAGFVFIILFLSIAVNLPHSMITRIGFDANYLLAALLAVAITGLVIHRHLFLISLVIFCTVAANLPLDVVSSWGVDRDYILATLVALVVLPVGAKLSGNF